MSTRLEKINKEIKRIEKRIALQQDQLKGAIQRRKDIENEEIIKSFRTLNLDHKELVSVVNGLQNGIITVEDIRKLAEVKDKPDKDGSDNAGENINKAGASDSKDMSGEYPEQSQELNNSERENTDKQQAQIESEGKSE